MLLKCRCLESFIVNYIEAIYIFKFISNIYGETTSNLRIYINFYELEKKHGELFQIIFLSKETEIVVNENLMLVKKTVRFKPFSREKQINAGSLCQ